MSFTGNLEDLAIVDVIQLLHSAKKSGTLTVRAGKRESQLVFDSGYMVSANHPDESYQIGKILVEMKAISSIDLEHVLAKQRQAGGKRKPLIGMLIEEGLIDREKAFRGLEFLIEMTIVEMVSWIRGTFTLDVDNIDVSDEYRYFPETLRQEMNLDTQMVLMDALRIFDEKKRDGEITEQIIEDEPAGRQPPDQEPVAEVLLEDLIEEDAAGESEAATREEAAESDVELSADDLGLADIDELDHKVPEVFSGLKAFDPADIHRQALAQSAPQLALEQREQLAVFLTEFATSISVEEASQRKRQPRAILLLSADELLRHALLTICKHEGIMVFVVDSGQALMTRLEQSLAKGILPLAVCDLPGSAGSELTAESLTELRREYRQRYPQLKLIQLTTPADDLTSGQAHLDGAKAVFSRPTVSGQPESFAADMVGFLESFLEFVVACFNEEGQQLLSWLNGATARLRILKEPQAVALSLLQSVAEQFSRTLTLVVAKGELIAERGVGLTSEPGEVSGPQGFRISLERPSVFRRVVESGEVFYGICNDALLQESLFTQLGAPTRANILLLPLRSRERTVSLTYADFGADEPLPVVAEAFEILARQAGLVIENALCRKQLAKTAR